MARVGLKRQESQIRLLISNALQTKLSDPRLDRLASITRVEVTADMAFANVYISVMGTDSQQNLFINGLQSAHGVLQSLLARKIRTRTCPSLKFHLDKSIKKSFETVRLINKSMEELAQRQGNPPDVRNDPDN